MNLKNRVNEKQYLIPLSRRQPFYYVEMCRILKRDDQFCMQRFIDGESVLESIPVGSVGLLICGPGVSITTEAIRIASSRGCIIFFSGQSGVPVFAKTVFKRSSFLKMKQYELFRSDARIDLIKSFLKKRSDLCDEFLSQCCPKLSHLDSGININNFLSIEGNWHKRLYAWAGSKHGVNSFKRKGSDNHPALFLNHLLYGVSECVITHLGLDPDIGLLHSQKRGGGFVYDVADIVKPLICIELAAISVKENYTLKEMKSEFFQKVLDIDVFSILIKFLRKELCL